MHRESPLPVPTERPLNILVVHRYFWPDTPPVAFILRSICDRWAAMGHNVSVYTSQPCCKPDVEVPVQPWREQVGELNVHRCWVPARLSRNGIVRAIGFLVFLLQAAMHIVFRRKKYDIVMGLTFPPVACGAFLSRAAKLRGSRFFYHCMDMHPEASVYSNLIQPQSLLARIGKYFDRGTTNRAERVIVLSSDMAATVLSRYDGANEAKRASISDKIRTITNFNPSGFRDEQAEAPSEYLKQDGKFRLLFAGNIGIFQALDNIVETAKLLTDYPDIEFVFLGEGGAKKGLVEQAGDLVGQTVQFIPHQPMEVADKIMQTADLCIVSLSPGMYKVAHPCKTSSYLSLGCPVLMIVEDDSEMYEMIHTNGLGYACKNEDPLALKEVILKAYSERADIANKREPAKQYAQNHLVKDALLKNWEQLIQEFSTVNQLPNSSQ